MFLRFVLVGASGFLIDAGLTYLFIIFGLPPWLARIPAIALAMAYTWLANRYFTYEVEGERSAGEIVRYVILATAMALLNYLIYIFQINNGIWPVAAVTIATACQTILSFHLYRHIVFRKLS